MCNATEKAFRERYFGRQLVDSGSMAEYDRTGENFGNAIYFPSNPFPFNPELGFMGARYLDSFAPVAPEYFRPGYSGILPLKEQPKLDLPLPYREPVLF